MVNNFDTPLSIMDRTNMQKSNKEIEGLKNTTDQLDLTDDTYWILWCTEYLPKAADKYYSQVHTEHSPE